MTKTYTSRELALFCDRTEERAAISDFLSNLYQGKGHAHPIVLNYYGVGGVGKTRLYQKSISDFRTQMEQDIYNLMPPKVAEVDLDSDSVKPDAPLAQILGRVRAALHRQGIKTPTFDYLYLTWWNEENHGQSIDFSRSTESERIGSLLDVAELASGLASLFGQELAHAAVAQPLRKLFPHINSWFARSRIQQRFDGTPEHWSQAERIERMPVLLASDLLDAIAQQPQTTICVIIDGFERVQSRELLPDAQRALARLVSEIWRCPEIIPSVENSPLRGRIGFIILGREILRWSELYANERVSLNWKQEIDSHAQLLGLTEDDARSFLIDLAAPWERDHNRDIVAQQIEQNAAQILEAASENDKESNRSFLPYYLDLAVILIRDNVHDFNPDMLGKSPSDLAIRFLRYLQKEHREVLQVLALALEFDRDTFAYLIERGFIRGYSAAHLSELVGDNWSFVTPSGNRPRFHSFHRHMQDSLIGSMAMSEVRERAEEIVAALLERHYELMQFQVPADFGVMQETAYSDATNLLLTHHSNGILRTETAISWMLRLQSLFAENHAMVLRQPGLHWAVDVSRRHMGEEHPDTLTSMNNLAMNLLEQGDLLGARVLQEKVLEMRRQVLGDQHPDTLTSMNNLGLVLQAQGDLPAARFIHENEMEICRQVLGEEHLDTLTSMNNLALTLHAQGDLSAAHALQEKVLEVRRRVLGEEHPKTLTSMNNLGLILQAQGDLSAARVLGEKVLEMRRRMLGEEHLDTLGAMGNLAVTLRRQGDLAAAHAINENELKISRRVLGEDHPDTLISMHNLGATLREQGNLPAARTLAERVQEMSWRVLGEEHPRTLTSMNNLALILGAQGDLAAARALMEKVLEKRLRVLGEGHPDTLASREDLASILGKQSESTLRSV